MEENKEFIKASNGYEYYRKKKEVNYDLRITLRVSSKTIEDLKHIASTKGTPYQKIIRSLIEEYVDMNKK